MAFIGKEQAFKEFQDKNPKYGAWLRAQAEKEKLQSMQLEERMRYYREREETRSADRIERIMKKFYAVQKKKDERKSKKVRRILDIVELRRTGLPLRDIAKRLGIPYQRVSQILHSSDDEEIRKLSLKHPTKRICQNCGITFDQTPTSTRTKCCSLECYSEIRKKRSKYPEDIVTARQRFRYRYNNNPEFRRRYLDNQRRFRYEREKKHPEKRERRLARNKEYNELYFSRKPVPPNNEPKDSLKYL